MIDKKDIENLYHSKKVRSYISVICVKQGRYDLIDDLLQFCMMRILEKDIDIINKNLVKYKKSLEDYFIGMIVNQINSNTSEFYKVYRNNGFFKSVDIDTNYEYNKVCDILTEDLSDEYYIKKDVKDELLLNKIKRAMLMCDPLKIDLFKMKYYDDRSYKEISEYYNIPLKSVINKVNNVKNDIKRLLSSDFSEKEIIKKKKEISRNNINDELKLKIVEEFKLGYTKKDLSNKYKISYPVILKIINKR